MVPINGEMGGDVIAQNNSEIVKFVEKMGICKVGKICQEALKRVD